VKSVLPSAIPHAQSLVSRFLSDDDDDFLSEILAQIEGRVVEDSNPTDTKREKVEPVVMA
jgi:hypothetical protein